MMLLSTVPITSHLKASGILDVHKSGLSVSISVIQAWHCLDILRIQLLQTAFFSHLQVFLLEFVWRAMIQYLLFVEFCLISMWRGIFCCPKNKQSHFRIGTSCSVEQFVCCFPNVILITPDWSSTFPLYLNVLSVTDWFSVFSKLITFALIITCKIFNVNI